MHTAKQFMFYLFQANVHSLFTDFINVLIRAYYICVNYTYVNKCLEEILAFFRSAFDNVFVWNK